MGNTLSEVTHASRDKPYIVFLICQSQLHTPHTLAEIKLKLSC